MTINRLILLLLAAVLCMGGSFTCRTGDWDEDEPPRRGTRVTVGFCGGGDGLTTVNHVCMVCPGAG